MIKVTVITPIYNESLDAINRTISSIKAQDANCDITHVICHDGPTLLDYSSLDNLIFSPRLGGYGSKVRQWVYENTPKADYYAFIDTGNMIFPDYISTNLSLLLNDPSVDFSTCSILHLGPLPRGVPAPSVLNGRTIKIGSIDTMQVFCREKVLKEVGWLEHQESNGYFSDGHTYSEWNKKFKFVSTLRVLGAHI
jgi:hypothetical protein